MSKLGEVRMATNNKNNKSGSSKKSSAKSAQNKAVKKGTKQAKRIAKKYPVATIVFLLILTAVFLVALFYGYYQGWWDFVLDPVDENAPPAHSADGHNTVYNSDDVAVHFLELGNKYTGDCVLIDVGETEILIDAGSKRNSAPAIKEYVDNYCDDGKLEYVIATHAHEDHIAAFVGNATYPGIFKTYEVGTIIDFPKTDSTSGAYKDYVSARDELVGKGTVHYNALQCWNNEGGAKRTYQIATGVTLSVLYQKYYETKASTENNYSVCVLLTQGGNNFLFTGDLEEAGEKSLAAENNLPKVKVFKGGHHGSATSNTDALLSKIQPEIVCVCTCCGSSEYKASAKNVFPSESFVNVVSKYTDKIYITTLMNDYSKGDFTSMNGNIRVISDGSKITVDCSNNNTIFKETAWFKANRTWP